jgi:hypothetical protein
MPSGGIKTISIIQADKPNTVISLDERTKTYSETEVKEQAAPTDNNCTVKIIGKEKAGNYNCTHVMVTENGHQTEYWMTTEISDFSKYGSSRKTNKYMGSGNAYAAMTKSGVTGFPVKTLSKDPKAGEIVIELVKLEKQDVPSSQFNIPSGYTKKTAAPQAPVIDVQKLQSMTPEERQKYAEELKKQYEK